MSRSLSALALLFLAACNSQQATPPEANEAASQAPQPSAPAAIPNLAGNWRVLNVDGNAAVGSLGMTASFGSGSATLATGCLKRAFTYTQDRNKVSFATSPSGSANCGRAPGADEEAAYAALEGANIAIFAGEGKQATLSGTGGVLALERR